MRPGRVWHRLVDLTSRREPATALALMRVGIGLTVLLTMTSLVRHVPVDLLFVDEVHGGYRPLASPWQVSALGGATPAVARALLGASMLASACLVVGFLGRWSALVTLFAYGGLTRLDPHSGGSYDALVQNALWLLVLAPATATLSLDCRIRTGRWVSATAVPAWTRYVAIYQVVLMYFTAGVQKVSADWIPGGDHCALYYILQWPAWRRFDTTWLGWAFPLTQLGTVATWCFEILSPLWLVSLWWHATRDRPGLLRRWSNRVHLRWWFFAFGIVLHLATWMLLEVGPFSPAALSMYACFVVPGPRKREIAERRSRSSDSRAIEPMLASNRRGIAERSNERPYAWDRS
jgi:hypothetical protein